MPTTSDLPDLRRHGYETLDSLGANLEGGRLTFRAQAIAGGRQVVIKQFRFARRGASWKEFGEHEREIEALRELRHPRIPAFLESFETDDGFCVVQAYVPHASLASRRSFELGELRAVAGSVLEILEYLQSRVPPVFHRDVKPANILVDGVGQAYLVDFGLARAGAGARSGSTIAVGTPGFMPPEQLFGRELTPSSDLYGLGATLIGLLSGRTAGEVGDLLDNRFQFRLDELPRSLPRAWVAWLGRLVAAEVEDRFADARAARDALPSPGDTTERSRKARVAAPDVARAIRESPDPQAARREVGAALSRQTRRSVLLVVIVGLVAVPIIYLATQTVFSKKDSASARAVTDDPAERAAETSGDVPAAAPAPEPAPSPRPETDEEKHNRWAGSACDGIVECYTEAGYLGPVTVRAEADIGADGKAVEARFEGDGARGIKSCVLSAMKSRVITDYDGGDGVLYCEISGQIMGGGTTMLGSGWGWRPAKARGGGKSSRPGADPKGGKARGGG